MNIMNNIKISTLLLLSLNSFSAFAESEPDEDFVEPHARQLEIYIHNFIDLQESYIYRDIYAEVLFQPYYGAPIQIDSAINVGTSSAPLTRIEMAMYNQKTAYIYRDYFYYISDEIFLKDYIDSPSAGGFIAYESWGLIEETMSHYGNIKVDWAWHGIPYQYNKDINPSKNACSNATWEYIGVSKEEFPIKIYGGMTTKPRDEKNPFSYMSHVCEYFITIEDSEKTREFRETQVKTVNETATTLKLESYLIESSEETVIYYQALENENWAFTDIGTVDYDQHNNPYFIFEDYRSDLTFKINDSSIVKASYHYNYGEIFCSLDDNQSSYLITFEKSDNKTCQLKVFEGYSGSNLAVEITNDLYKNGISLLSNASDSHAGEEANFDGLSNIDESGDFNVILSYASPDEIEGWATYVIDDNSQNTIRLKWTLNKNNGNTNCTSETTSEETLISTVNSDYKCSFSVYSTTEVAIEKEQITIKNHPSEAILDNNVVLTFEKFSEDNGYFERSAEEFEETPINMDSSDTFYFHTSSSKNNDGLSGGIHYRLNGGYTDEDATLDPSFNPNGVTLISTWSAPETYDPDNLKCHSHLTYFDNNEEENTEAPYIDKFITTHHAAYTHDPSMAECAVEVKSNPDIRNIEVKFTSDSYTPGYLFVYDVGNSDESDVIMKHRGNTEEEITPSGFAYYYFDNIENNLTKNFIYNLWEDNDTGLNMTISTVFNSAEIEKSCIGTIDSGKIALIETKLENNNTIICTFKLS